MCVRASRGPFKKLAVVFVDLCRARVVFFAITMVDRTMLLLLLVELALLRGAVDGTDLKGSPVPCEVEGAVVEVPSISSDPCITCICQANKQVKCDREICPNRKNCYLLLFGQNKSCCDMCKGCYYEDRNYADGEDWSDPTDPCRRFSCQGGVVTETLVQCYSSCRNPIPPEPGTCCSSCLEDDDCPAQDSRKSVVLATPQTDPCVTCECKGNMSECTKRACPVLPCPTSKQVYKRGSCCPVCTGSRRVFDVDSRCLLGMQIFKTGEAFQIDPCTNCTCNDSTIFCERESCPPLHCRPELHVKGEGCCPRCRDPEEQRAACLVSGRRYQDGEHWRLEPCTECSCRDGQVSCAARPCNARIACPSGHSLRTKPGECCPTCVEDDGVCTVYGDPHYRTFDGKMFNYQGSCKYVLARDCGGGGAFSVEVLNEARYSRNFSWTKSVTVRANGTKIRLGQYLKIHVNQKPVKLPYVDLGVLTVFQEDRNVHVRTNMGVRVLWDGSSYLEVTVPPKFRGQTCGLCGNYNGNPMDDFMTKGGALVEKPEPFGESWRVGKMKRCKTTSSPTSPAAERRRNPDVHVRALRECNVLKSPVFKPCHRTVSAVPYYNSCYLDAGECRPRDRCYCESLTAYARHCARAGKELSPDWRSATGCDGIRCGNGQQYMSCAPACRKTCKKPRRDKNCRKQCRPGCYCPPGTVWHRKKCIPLDECPS